MSGLKTGEQKQAAMSRDRSALKSLFESASNNNVPGCMKAIHPYVNLETSTFEALTQFKDGRERTVLHFAAQNWAKDVVVWIKELIEQEKVKKEDKDRFVNGKDEKGITPLMCLCMNLPPPSVPSTSLPFLLTTLLSLSASIPLPCNSGATSLHYASGSGLLQAVQLLLTSPSSKSTLHSLSEAGTPLHWASGSPHPDAPGIVKLLLEADPDTANAKDRNGLPPLITAAAGGLDGVASELVGGGADVGVLLGGGISVAHIAADNGMVGTLKAMARIETGRKAMMVVNDDGETPAELAAGQEYRECVRVILEATGEGEGWEVKYGELKAKSDGRVRSKPEEAEGGKKKKGGDEGEEEEVVWEEEVKAVEEWRKAVESKGEVTDSDKEEARAAKEMGNKEFGAGKYSEAASHYTRAISLDPTDPTYYSNRCACYLKQKSPLLALPDAAVVRAARPEWNKGHHRLATARMALGRYQAAAEAAWEGLKEEAGNQDLKDIMQKAVKKGREENKKMGK